MTTYKPKYFKWSDFTCKCNGYCDHSKTIVPELMIALDKLRNLIGKPVIVNCGVRCEKHNKEVGGIRTSPHLSCTAADIYSPGITAKQLAKFASQIPEFAGGGIGTYMKKNFVHVDVRGHRARWFG